MAMGRCVCTHSPNRQALHLFGGFGRLVAPLVVRYFISSTTVHPDSDAADAGSNIATLAAELNMAYFAASTLPMLATAGASFTMDGAVA